AIAHLVRVVPAVVRIADAELARGVPAPALQHVGADERDHGAGALPSAGQAIGEERVAVDRAQVDRGQKPRRRVAGIYSRELILSRAEAELASEAVPPALLLRVLQDGAHRPPGRGDLSREVASAQVDDGELDRGVAAISPVARAELPVAVVTPAGDPPADEERAGVELPGRDLHGDSGQGERPDRIRRGA